MDKSLLRALAALSPSDLSRIAASGLSVGDAGNAIAGRDLPQGEDVPLNDFPARYGDGKRDNMELYPKQVFPPPFPNLNEMGVEWNQRHRRYGEPGDPSEFGPTQISDRPMSPLSFGALSPPSQRLNDMMAQSMANLPNAGPTAYNEEMKRKILRAMLAGQK